MSRIEVELAVTVSPPLSRPCRDLKPLRLFPALVRRRSLMLAMPSCVPGYFQSPLTRLVLAMLDGIKLHNPLIESH